MSVVVWDGVTLAADKRSMCGDYVMQVRKIFRLDDGSLAGLVGEVHRGVELIEWLNKSRDPKDFPRDPDDDTELLHIALDGTINSYHGNGYPITFEAPFAAIGSGMGAALAALYCERTAVEAVEIAAKVVSSVGDGVDSMTLSGR